MSDNWIQDIASRQPALSEQDRLLRDEFVEQYFLDFNPISAVIRLGYNSTYADHMSKQFMLDSYVLRRISEFRKNSSFSNKERLKNWVSAELMSRACYNGPGSSETAKIHALKVLVDLHGLAEIPAKPDGAIEGEYTDETELSEEELEKELAQRGLPTSIFTSEEDEFIKKREEIRD